MLLFFCMQFRVHLLDWWIVGITDASILHNSSYPVPYVITNFGFSASTHLTLPISMAGYTYNRYLMYLSELLLLIMLTYYKVLTWFLHVLLLCPRWPQSEHLIGDSSGSRNSLRRRSRLLRGRPGCRFVTAGGLVTPSCFTLSMHVGKMLFLYISCTYSNL